MCDNPTGHDPRTAVLFVSHFVTPETLWNYFRIQRAVPEECDVYWVYQGDLVPPWLSRLSIDTFEFTDDELAEWNPVMNRDTLIPGNLHVLTIAFSQHQAYDRYWFIEYDVRFTGDWERVFRLARTSAADLIAAYVESPFEDAAWSHWDTIHLPYTELARSFNPIHRVSSRVLKQVAELITNGYWAHNEALLASVCQNEGWRMDDFNALAFDHWGMPLYTPAPNADAASTLNYRPVASTIWSGEPDQLHHPVKPVQWFLKHHGRRRGPIEALRARPQTRRWNGY
jgi:hypothetical protein